MSCKVGWTSEYIDEILSQNFRNNELRIHRENVLFSLEKSLLPSTITYIKEDVGQLLLNLEKYISSEYTKLSKTRNVWNLDSSVTNLSDIEIRNYYKVDRKYEDKKLRAFHSLVIGYLDILDEKNTKIYKYPCPIKDCRGYICDDAECGLCDIKVESNKKYGTILCPKCGSINIKIDECTDIYCIKCHLAFNWITKVTEIEKIHNPYYYDIIDNIELSTEETDAIKIKDYISEVIIPSYIDKDIEQKYRDLRVSYLLKKINEDEWRKKLYAYDNENRQKKDIREIFEMFVDVMNYNKIEKLREYFNKVMIIVLKRHRLKKIIEINELWEINC
jgi:hypothetical protein